ncbi:MAG: hypothetical protein CFE29_07200 [Bradyrhizobiaceae bacterium PARB1]|nr:MAG: hypothetical protein CFE29_07200 [Bradyrhizobiaceae bacterium PARB1]
MHVHRWFLTTVPGGQQLSQERTAELTNRRHVSQMICRFRAVMAVPATAGREAAGNYCVGCTMKKAASMQPILAIGIVLVTMAA